MGRLHNILAGRICVTYDEADIYRLSGRDPRLVSGRDGDTRYFTNAIEAAELGSTEAHEDYILDPFPDKTLAYKIFHEPYTAVLTAYAGYAKNDPYLSGLGEDAMAERGIKKFDAIYAYIKPGETSQDYADAFGEQFDADRDPNRNYHRLLMYNRANIYNAATSVGVDMSNSNDHIVAGPGSHVAVFDNDGDIEAFLYPAGDPVRTEQWGDWDVRPKDDLPSWMPAHIDDILDAHSVSAADSGDDRLMRAVNLGGHDILDPHDRAHALHGILADCVTMSDRASMSLPKPLPYARRPDAEGERIRDIVENPGNWLPALYRLPDEAETLIDDANRFRIDDHLPPTLERMAKDPFYKGIVDEEGHVMLESWEGVDPAAANCVAARRALELIALSGSGYGVNACAPGISAIARTATPASAMNLAVAVTLKYPRWWDFDWRESSQIERDRAELASDDPDAPAGAIDRDKFYARYGDDGDMPLVTCNAKDWVYERWNAECVAEAQVGRMCELQGADDRRACALDRYLSDVDERIGIHTDGLALWEGRFLDMDRVIGQLADRCPDVARQVPDAPKSPARLYHRVSPASVVDARPFIDTLAREGDMSRDAAWLACGTYNHMSFQFAYELETARRLMGERAAVLQHAVTTEAGEEAGRRADALRTMDASQVSPLGRERIRELSRRYDDLEEGAEAARARAYGLLDGAERAADDLEAKVRADCARAHPVAVPDFSAKPVAQPQDDRIDGLIDAVREVSETNRRILDEQRRREYNDLTDQLNESARRRDANVRDYLRQRDRRIAAGVPLPGDERSTEEILEDFKRQGWEPGKHYDYDLGE